MSHDQRLNKVWNAVSQSCEGFLVQDTTNLYYLTGIHLSLGTLFIKKDERFLLVDNRYYEMCKNLPFVKVLESEKQTLVDLLQEGMHVGFDSECMTVIQYQQLQESLKNKNITFNPLSYVVATIRAIKEQEELKILKEAARLNYKGFLYAKSLLKEGITELEVAKELEIYWLKNGGNGLSFDSIIAFSANSSMPHYRAAHQKLRKDDVALIDIGVEVQGYQSDLTRTLFVGEGIEAIKTIYPIVQEAQALALNLCKPGTLVSELDDAARGFIAKKGYLKNFQHGLGHGVGLEIHELPVLRNKKPYGDIVLQEGMVITIEPGIYLPGIGGVRIEDTVAITKNSYENLTMS